MCLPLQRLEGQGVRRAVPALTTAACHTLLQNASNAQHPSLKQVNLFVYFVAVNSERAPGWMLFPAFTSG